ncbi:MAG: tetratricopeptide repeat protein [Bacteroidota bacterium]
MRQFLLILSIAILYSCSKPDYMALRSESLLAFTEERYKESLAPLEKLLKKYPQDAPYTLMLAQSLYHSGQKEEAFSFIDKSLEIDPKFAEAFQVRAAFLAYEESFTQALKDIETAIKLMPENVEFYITAGDIYKKTGKIEGAKAYYSQAIELAPMNPFPYNNRGHLYLGQLAYGDAILDFDKVVELGAASTNTYINRGYARMKITADSLALVDFEKALELAETSKLKGIALNNLGNVKMLLGDVEAAWQDINAGINLYPDNSYAYRNKALVLIAMKRFPEACDALSVSLDLGFSKNYGNEVEELRAQHCR